MPKKLFITGGSGFFGSRAAEYFKQSYLVFAPGHDELDLTDERGVLSYVSSLQPDLILHCAAISDTGVCEKNPDVSYAINVKGSETIATAAKQVNAKCILCSSDQVYFGCPGTSAHREETALSPANRYGRQKLLAEERCLQQNASCVLLRLTWMYDTVSHCPTEHGDFFRTLSAGLQAKKDLAYPIYDRRGITYIWDVIHRLDQAFLLPGGVYNFGSENTQSTYDMVFDLFQAFEYDTKSLRRNEQAFCGCPRNLCMDTSKIRAHGIAFPSAYDGLYAALQSL